MRINGNIALTKIKWAHIIESDHVVIVLVREEDAIDFFDIIGNHLLSKIWPAINDITVVFPFQKN